MVPERIIKIHIMVIVDLNCHIGNFYRSNSYKRWEGINISTEKRLDEIERKLDDLHNKISKQENRTNYKPIFVVLLILSAILIFFVLIGVVSFFTL